MPKDHIDFEFDGKKYRCTDVDTAYMSDHAKLPDGRFVYFKSWKEGVPPLPERIVASAPVRYYAEAIEV